MSNIELASSGQGASSASTAMEAAQRTYTLLKPEDPRAWQEFRDLVQFVKRMGAQLPFSEASLDPGARVSAGWLLTILNIWRSEAYCSLAFPTCAGGA